MRGWRLHSDGGDRARLFVASGARWSGFAVGPKGLNWGNRPVARRQLGDAAGEIGKAGLIGKQYDESKRRQ